jgi:hypothetical protein
VKQWFTTQTQINCTLCLQKNQAFEDTNDHALNCPNDASISTHYETIFENITKNSPNETRSKIKTHLSALLQNFPPRLLAAGALPKPIQKLICNITPCTKKFSETIICQLAHELTTSAHQIWKNRQEKIKNITQNNTYENNIDEIPTLEPHCNICKSPVGPNTCCCNRKVKMEYTKQIGRQETLKLSQQKIIITKPKSYE